MSVLGELGTYGLDLLYPRCCAVCGDPVDVGNRYVCWDCRADFAFIERPYCEVCGDPIAGRADDPFTCAWCRRDPPAFTRARSVVRYRDGVQDCLRALKYHRATYLAADMAQLLATCVDVHLGAAGIDLVVPVPLHSRRKRERTYNQAQLIAEGVARRLGLRCEARALRRTRATPSQTTLNMRARRDNVHGAFAVRDGAWIRGRRVLVVDDVMTTGATVREVSRELRDAGAARVDVATVARG